MSALRIVDGLAIAKAQSLSLSWPGAGLDGAGCREQQVGKGVANAAEPQLVARVLFGEEGDNVGHLAAVILRKIDPREHRRHGVAPSF
jgi:hypothetical protein